MTQIRDEAIHHPTRRRWWATTAAVLLTIGLLPLTVMSAHSAPSWELLITSLGQDPDANPGDGLCATADGSCTLRAAIQESNALNAGAGEVRIGVHPGFAGGRIDLVATTSTWMNPGPIAVGGNITGDSGAVFDITAPVDIDLEHRVSAAPSGTLAIPAALFHVNGPQIMIRGLDHSWTGGTTFYVAAGASNVLITDGTVHAPSVNAGRFFLVRGGARDVVLRDYTVQGYAGNSSMVGWGYIDGAYVTPVDGLTLDNLEFLVDAAGRCDATDGSGCSSNVLSARRHRLTSFTMTNCTVVNSGRVISSYARLLDLRQAVIGRFEFSGNRVVSPRMVVNESLIDFGVSAYGATLTDVLITDNEFSGVSAASEEMNGMIRFPGNLGIAGSALIARNTVLADDAQSHAIYWHGPHGDTVNVTASGLVIEDNHFDGWGDNSSRSTIRLYQTGAVTVRRNTFGADTGTQVNTVTEEGTASGSYATTMLSNWSYGANGKLNTWYPTARSSANVQSAAVTARSCTIDLELAPPSDAANSADLTLARYPAVPVSLDLFWTAARTAEVYLESVTVATNARTTVTVALPLPGDARLSGLDTGAAQPVDPATGAVSGGIRLQTHDPNAGATTASSQYSRVALIDGNCSPILTIDQADDQQDPTLLRDLRYTVLSTMPLSGLSPAQIDLAVAATVETVDAARIAPRVVSTTVDPASDGTRFTVVARVDDSAVVTAAIPAGRVTSTLGLTNVAAASSTDPDITYRNPLRVAPAAFPLVTGHPDGQEYALSVLAEGPVPTADLVFTATPDRADLVLSTTSPVLVAGGSRVAVRVTALAGEVVAGTRAAISHTVASADQEFDGLVVPAVHPVLYATDPTVRIEKHAYRDVVDSSSPAGIVATGTALRSGSRAIAGETICFVYTVTNISADDWASELTGAVVTDSDTRLGTGGLIGVVDRLGIGQSVQLAACAVLLPTDG